MDELIKALANLGIIVPDGMPLVELPKLLKQNKKILKAHDELEAAKKAEPEGDGEPEPTEEPPTEEPPEPKKETGKEVPPEKKSEPDKPAPINPESPANPPTPKNPPLKLKDDENKPSSEKLKFQAQR